MPEDSDLDDTPGLLRALQVLRERWWVIALCGVIAAGAAAVYVERKPNQYTASASLQFTSNSLPSQVAGVGSGSSLDPEGEKNTNVQLVTATPVAELVIKALKLQASPGALLEEVTATDPQNDYIVQVSVTDENPERAAKLANAFAEQYVVYSRQQNEQQLIKGQQLIAQHIAELPPGDTTDRANLNTLSQKLLLLQSVAAANARVANTASTPSAPSAPKRTSTTLIALVFGLLLGVGMAFLINMVNRRVRTWEEFEKLYGFRVLSAIPQLVRPPRTARERDIEMEPFRILHNSLSLLAREGKVKTVLVTSSVPGEGKTTVATGLARAAADAGSRVALVEADLRRPSFADRLRIDSKLEGLSGALFDDEDPLELMQTPYAELPGLEVLPAGQVPADATQRLRSYDVARVFDALASHFDLVVIDSAPLLPVVDTRVLLDELNLDVQLIVARSSVTTRDQIRAVRTLFEQRRLKQTVGLVVNALSSGAGTYYYGTDAPGAEPPPGEHRKDLVGTRGGR